MRWLALSATSLVACADTSEATATCDGEVELVAPTVVREVVTIQKTIPFARCLRLDSTEATTSTSLLITAGYFGDPQFNLALRSSEGAELAVGVDQLEVELPAGEVAHAILEIRLLPGLSSAGSNLAFDFFVEP